MQGPITLLRSAFDTFFKNPMLFIGIYLVPVVATAIGVGILVVGALVASAFESTVFAITLGLLVALIAIIGMMIAFILMGVAMLFAVGNPEKFTVMTVYKKSMPYILPYIWISFLGMLLLLAVCLLAVAIIAVPLMLMGEVHQMLQNPLYALICIVPVFIVGLYFMFAHYALVFEDIRGIAALKKSYRYVTGKWFSVFLRVIALSFVVGILGAVIGLPAELNDLYIIGIATAVLQFVFQMVMTPVSIAYYYGIYTDLKNAK